MLDYISRLISKCIINVYIYNIALFIIILYKGIIIYIYIYIRSNNYFRIPHCTMYSVQCTVYSLMYSVHQATSKQQSRCQHYQYYVHYYQLT